MPDPASAQGERILDLWQGAWIAAMVTGVIVWALIFYAIVKFRRRSDDEIPVQTRYNLPLEIFYTIAPIIMVVVFFAHTVEAQNFVLDEDAQGGVDNTIEITGQQWSWTFNYGIGEVDRSADDDLYDDEFPYDSYVYTAGTAGTIPTLVLPVGQTTRFNLHSPDVIHDFGVPAFLMKMDVVPGRVNHYAITPTVEGDVRGQVLRALRRLPLADALQGQGRQRGGVRRLRREPGRGLRGQRHRAGCARSRWRDRLAPRPDSTSPAKSPRRGRSDRHSSTPDQRRRP